MKDNTFATAPGSGGFSGTINLVQDLSEVSVLLHSHFEDIHPEIKNRIYPHRITKVSRALFPL